MAEEGRVRRKALTERLNAKRRAKEAELDKRGAGEKERCDQNIDLNRLEDLEAEVRTVCPMLGVCSRCLGQRKPSDYVQGTAHSATSLSTISQHESSIPADGAVRAASLSLLSRFLGLCGPFQALDEKLQTERQARLKEVRACAAAAEEAATLANSRMAGDTGVGATAAVTSSKMKVRESPGLRVSGWLLKKIECQMGFDFQPRARVLATNNNT